MFDVLTDLLATFFFEAWRTLLGLIVGFGVGYAAGGIISAIIAAVVLGLVGLVSDISAAREIGDRS